MEALEAIFSRRSIRKYSAKRIPDSDIDLILKAAMSAPSAGNSQPWHFVVVDSTEKKKEIADFHHHGKMIARCSHAIVVCADRTLEKYEGRYMLDCSASTQNILLAATALGIGSVWVGLYPVEDRMNGIIKICKLPDNHLPISIVALGYPDEIKEKQDRFKIERIHKNTY